MTVTRTVIVYQLFSLVAGSP